MSGGGLFGVNGSVSFSASFSTSFSALANVDDIASATSFNSLTESLLPVIAPSFYSLSSLMSDKYANLHRVVASLEPADVGQIFRCASSAEAFFPSWGLFATEFSLGYCQNLPHKRDAPPPPKTLAARRHALEEDDDDFAK